MPKGVVLADAGCSNDTAFRSGLTELGLTYVVGVQGATAWNRAASAEFRLPAKRLSLRVRLGQLEFARMDGILRVTKENLHAATMEIGIFILGSDDDRVLPVNRHAKFACRFTGIRHLSVATLPVSPAYYNDKTAFSTRPQAFLYAKRVACRRR